jgi:hypothetical protein
MLNYFPKNYFTDFGEENDAFSHDDNYKYFQAFIFIEKKYTSVCESLHFLEKKMRVKIDI